MASENTAHSSLKNSRGRWASELQDSRKVHQGGSKSAQATRCLTPAALRIADGRQVRFMDNRNLIVGSGVEGSYIERYETNRESRVVPSAAGLLLANKQKKRRPNFRCATFLLEWRVAVGVQGGPAIVDRTCAWLRRWWCVASRRRDTQQQVLFAPSYGRAGLYCSSLKNDFAR